MRILAWIVVDGGRGAATPSGPAQPLVETWLRRLGGERTEAA
jgi:hypothetical protein